MSGAYTMAENNPHTTRHNNFFRLSVLAASNVK